MGLEVDLLSWLGCCTRSACPSCKVAMLIDAAQKMVRYLHITAALQLYKSRLFEKQHHDQGQA